MGEYAAEQASTDLQELGVILRAWHNNRDSDSVFIQNLRNREYWAGVRFMRRLIYGVQPERRLHLKVGETALQTARFGELEPGYEFDLRKEDIRVSVLPMGRTPQEELFVGWGPDRVALSQVARTLTEGGELSVIETPVVQRAA